MSDFKIWVCPVCREQTDDDPEYGAGHYHDEYGQVDAIQIRVEPFWDDLDDKRIQFEPKLAEQKAAKEERDKKRAEWEALPQEEKDRREAERRSKMTPMQRMTEDAMKAMVADSVRLLNRDPFDWKGSYTVIPVAGSTEPERSG